MDSRILDRRGVTILELMITILIITIILSMIIPNSVQRIQNVQFQKTVAEMNAITQSSIDFYISQGACPSAISQLVPTYLPQLITFSPFNSDYQLNCASNLVSVSDLIPTGLAQKNPEGPLLEVATTGGQDNITISQRIPLAFTGRLFYDKQHIYGGS